MSFHVIEGGGQPEPKVEEFTPAHGIAIACFAGAIFWLGLGAAALAWWDRP
jgi:hypothetical protein